MKVNKNTRAGKNGKCIQCPTCGHKLIVYHFAWCASSCWTKHAGGCGKMVDKGEWLVIG